MRNLISNSLLLPTQYLDVTLEQKSIIIDAIHDNIDTGGETTPYTISFFPEFMKIPNYSSRDTTIHAAEDMAKALQITSPEPPFQVGYSQIKAIRN